MVNVEGVWTKLYNWKAFLPLGDACLRQLCRETPCDVLIRASHYWSSDGRKLYIFRSNDEKCRWQEALSWKLLEAGDVISWWERRRESRKGRMEGGGIPNRKWRTGECHCVGDKKRQSDAGDKMRAGAANCNPRGVTLTFFPPSTPSPPGMSPKHKRSHARSMAIVTLWTEKRAETYRPDRLSWFTTNDKTRGTRFYLWMPFTHTLSWSPLVLWIHLVNAEGLKRTWYNDIPYIRSCVTTSVCYIHVYNHTSIQFCVTFYGFFLSHVIFYKNFTSHFLYFYICVCIMIISKRLWCRYRLL